jgi:hypothetical protein
MFDSFKFISSTPVFSTKDQLKASLKTVVEYCERNEKATPLVKHQLRSIHKILQNPENGIDAANIIVMMASHG